MHHEPVTGDFGHHRGTCNGEHFRVAFDYRTNLVAVIAKRWFRSMWGGVTFSARVGVGVRVRVRVRVRVSDHCRG